MQINGVEAWITGEDKVHLDEFAPEFDQESDVVTCWISGEPGQVRRIFPDSMRGTDVLVPLPTLGQGIPLVDLSVLPPSASVLWRSDHSQPLLIFSLLRTSLFVGAISPTLRRPSITMISAVL